MTHDRVTTHRREEEVMGVGSIRVAILPSCQHMKTIALHKHEYSLGVIYRNTSETVIRSQYSPWPSY